MLTFHCPRQKAIQLDTLDRCHDLTLSSVWIDVFEPTRAEEMALEASLGIDVPTREEMQEIELSRRLYVEKGNVFMTATVLTKADTSHPESTAITFILLPERLVTLRYSKPVPFQVFSARRDANPDAYDSPTKVFTGLIDAIIERLADILENTSAGMERLSLEVLADGLPEQTKASAGPARKAAPSPPKRDYKDVLRRIGRHSDLASRVRESLVSVGRLISFFGEAAKEGAVAHVPFAHLKVVRADLTSLTDHASFLSGKMSFLLDATLGLINNEQNAIIKIVSVAAVVFLPPTLVASIYGMNFDVMPELKWQVGYPLALALMAISAVLPYLFFKRKGWL